MDETRHNEITRLHDTSLLLQGARRTLMRLHDDGLLAFERNGRTTRDGRVCTEAVYDLLMHDDLAMMLWTAADIRIEYYGHEKDAKGRLLRCKARLAKR